ncbi:MAG: hypothetical protein MUP22_00750 [Desulfobacterales bacterium]|nr:hypothetical protein [Desulfobacterales bacterium]
MTKHRKTIILTSVIEFCFATVVFLHDAWWIPNQKMRREKRLVGRDGGKRAS